MAAKKESYTEEPHDTKKTEETVEKKEVKKESTEFVTKTDFEAWGKSLTESLLTIFTPSKIQEIRDETLRQKKPFMLDEIKNEYEGIEKVTDSDFIKGAEALEAFANEFVVIEVHPPVEDGDLDVIAPSVNGFNQPIVRGVPTKVRRKYVEALARCKITEYDQKEIDKTDPTKRRMIPKTRFAYPFTVIQDNNPRGRDWLNALSKEAY